MKSIIPIIALFLIITSCTNSKKQLSVRDTAISLIEKEYPVDGRKLEYSQLDSTDAELKGYDIWRVYINTNDSIKLEQFHLNYIKTKADLVSSSVVSPEQYKVALIGDSIFTNDVVGDFKRLYNYPRDEYSHLEGYDTREADSLAAVEALEAEAAAGIIH